MFTRLARIRLLIISLRRITTFLTINFRFRFVSRFEQAILTETF